MRFVGAFDAIFRLAVARKLFDHFEDATWRVSSRHEGNNISELEFVGGRVSTGAIHTVTHIGLRHERDPPEMAGFKPVERNARQELRATSELGPYTSAMYEWLGIMSPLVMLVTG
jgi:hypothetical protein